MRKTIILSLLAFFSVCTIAAEKKVPFPELTKEENTRSKQWLAKHHVDPDSSSLLKALVSFHYTPEASLAPYLSGKLGRGHKQIILSLMILQCENHPLLAYCQEGNLEKELVELDSSNLFPYVLQFNQFVAQSDNKKALLSLKQGLKTTELNDYFFDKVMYLRNELRALGYQGGRANLAAEMYSVNGMLIVYGNVMPVCDSHVKEDKEWKTICLRLSKRLEQGTTFLSNIVGAALRRNIVKATSTDEKKIQAAIDHRVAYNIFRDNARTKNPTWDHPTLKPDSFYENAVKYGELKAFKILTEQVDKAPFR